MKMPDTYKEAHQWATDRIGKTVYRKEDTCSCGVCQDIAEKGLVIQDQLHATYITDCAMEMNYRYADSKEEL